VVERSGVRGLRPERALSLLSSFLPRMYRRDDLAKHGKFGRCLTKASFGLRSSNFLLCELGDLCERFSACSCISLLHLRHGIKAR
jgi:hypothetical protein